jgi:diaminohydroxyphosphoribosylaminopyrimidine deaminase/5-amino-6-(5-phosphoribosylamino)uracil reductase
MDAASPVCTLNVEVPLDRRPAPTAPVPPRITTSGNLARLDRLRAHFGAVMIGQRAATLGGAAPATIASDHLRAQRRAEGRSEQPVNVLIADDATALLGTPLLSGARAAGVPLRIITSHRTPRGPADDLRRTGAHVAVVGDGEVDLPAALRELGRAGIEQMFVEGDDDLNAALLALDVVDELALYISPFPRRGRDALALARALGRRAWLRSLPPLDLKAAQEVDDDLMGYYTVLGGARKRIERLPRDGHPIP